MSAATSGAEAPALTIEDLHAKFLDLARRVDALTAARPDTRMKLRDVMQTAALSESTINRGVKAGTFPEPVGYFGRVRLWSARDVQAWVEAQAASPHPAPQLRGVATWTPKQHADRERRKRVSRSRL